MCHGNGKRLHSAAMSIKEIYLHPTLVLSLADHFHRVQVTNDEQTKTSPLVGIILGKRSSQTSSMLSSFELPHCETTDVDGLEQHLMLLSEIYGKNYLELVGFYTIGTGNVSALLKGLLSNVEELQHSSKNIPILGVDSSDTLLHLNISNFSEVDAHTPLTEMIQITQLSDNSSTPIPFEVRLVQAESVALATYSKAPQVVDGNQDNALSQDIHLALEDLSLKLRKALLFLAKVKSGSIDLTQSKDARDAFESLSYLSHHILSLKEALSKEGEDSTNKNEEHIDKLITYGSVCSSLLRENLEYSI